jgi:hypothetical protein
VSLAVLKHLERNLNDGREPDSPGLLLLLLLLFSSLTFVFAGYRHISEFFDLICGTSTGGIIAFAIGVGWCWIVSTLSQSLLSLSLSLSLSLCIGVANVVDRRRNDVSSSGCRGV